MTSPDAAPDALPSRPAVPRPQPETDSLDEVYWTSGRSGALRLARCRDCRYWINPPSPVCPSCLSRHVADEPVSGRGTLWTYTVNMHPWSGAFPVPWPAGLVELVEQDGLRILGPIVGVPPEEIAIGMELTLDFEQRGDVYVPVFVRGDHD